MEMDLVKTKLMNISRQRSPLQSVTDQKQLENVKYFNYLGSMITNGARCARGTKSRIVMAQAAFNRKKGILNCKLDFNLRKKLVKYNIWSIALYGAETWTP